MLNQFAECFFKCSIKNMFLKGNLFNRHKELLERVLCLLFVLSRSRVGKLRHFALQFAPTLIYIELLSLSIGDTKVG